MKGESSVVHGRVCVFVYVQMECTLEKDVIRCS